MRRHTTEWFITKSKTLFGDRFTYEHTNYRGYKNRVTIYCTCCKNTFQIFPVNHFVSPSGGCKICSIKNKRVSLEEFVKRANEIYGDKYSYDKAEYTRNSNPILVTCKKHGDFLVTPTSFIDGKHGCRKCWLEVKEDHSRHTTEWFISEASKYWQNKFDYSLSNYRGLQKHVVVICKKHGKFNTIPANHLRGSGCPICMESKGETAIREWLNNHNIKFKYEVKFNECRYIKQLSFDFAVYKEDELKGLIEYDGEQHFRPVKGWGEDKNYKLVCKRDIIKNNFCLQNMIPLLRIPYSEKDRINSILENFVLTALQL